MKHFQWLEQFLLYMVIPIVIVSICIYGGVKMRNSNYHMNTVCVFSNIIIQLKKY